MAATYAALCIFACISVIYRMARRPRGFDDSYEALGGAKGTTHLQGGDMTRPAIESGDPRGGDTA